MSDSEFCSDYQATQIGLGVTSTDQLETREEKRREEKTRECQNRAKQNR
jgi:hypothetical protein